MKDSPVTDNNDLASFGYRQELKRSMGSFSSFAAGFSYISILTGLFQMFYLGYGVAGPGIFLDLAICIGGSIAGGALLCRTGFQVSVVWRGLSMGKVYRKPFSWMDDRLDLPGLSYCHYCCCGHGTPG